MFISELGELFPFGSPEILDEFGAFKINGIAEEGKRIFEISLPEYPQKGLEVTEYGEILAIGEPLTLDEWGFLKINGIMEDGRVVPSYVKGLECWRNALFSMKVRGKLDNVPPEVRGIYQQRMTRRGKITLKMKMYAPTNPQTEAQQANRGKFADAVQAWQSLTNEEKNVYNKLKYPHHMSGYNKFLSNYLKSH